MVLDDWAKQFIKFSAETRSLTSELSKLSLSEAEDLWKVLEQLDKVMEANEKKLSVAAVDAYEAGVVSKKVAEFLKNKPFADAKKRLDENRKSLVDGLKDLEAYCDKCKAGGAKAYDLAQRMSKAIMADKSKDKNPEREKVKKLREGVMDRFEELSKAEKLRHKPPKYMQVFDAQYDKLIDHLIAEAIKKGKDPDAQLEVPQPLTDKNLGLLSKEITRFGTSIGTSVGEIDSIAGKVTAIKDKLAKLKAEGKELKVKAEAPNADKDKIAKAMAKFKESENVLSTDAVTLRNTAEELVHKAGRSLDKLKAVLDKVEKLETQFKAEIALLPAKDQSDLADKFKSMRTQLKKAEASVEKATLTTNRMY